MNYETAEELVRKALSQLDEKGVVLIGELERRVGTKVLTFPVYVDRIGDPVIRSRRDAYARA